MVSPAHDTGPGFRAPGITLTTMSGVEVGQDGPMGPIVVRHWTLTSLGWGVLRFHTLDLVQWANNEGLMGF